MGSYLFQIKIMKAAFSRFEYESTAHLILLLPFLLISSYVAAASSSVGT